ncbi:hypothetical protein UFOVP787_114 [uncultured Caudovirales phage]|uniref:Uncharacterized protein n=1 Tax=uncultured Caudovirales phage TaxID=2100421 RepID=A0A6J5NUV6_9CAUD|nr:hypothetical protein UFOVP787_114 [uncultured Caudovirales phage]
MSKENKKLPEKVGPNKSEPIYPYYRVEETTNGKKTVSYDNPNKPDEAWEFSFGHAGDYETRQFEKDYKGVTTKLSHQTHSYATEGKSEQVDSHNDRSGEATDNKNVAGDTASASGKTSMEGSQKKVSANKEGSFSSTTEGNSNEFVKGDKLQNREGSEYNSIEGDEIKSVGGNKIQIIQNGEFQTHVQDGNMDTRVESGKYKTYSSDEMILESATKITLKVGSSTIVIDTNSITITSSRIDLNP